MLHILKIEVLGWARVDQKFSTSCVLEGSGIWKVWAGFRSVL